MKKVFALFLSILMIFTVMPSGIAFAEDTPLPITGCIISLSESEKTYNGEVFAPTVSVTLNETDLLLDTDYTLTYEDELSTDAGEYGITVTGIGAYTGEQALTYKINPFDITEGGLFSLEKEVYTYTGEEIKPEVMGASEDFTLTYEEDLISIGEKNITVTSNNPNYTGEAVLTYLVAKDTVETIKDNFSLTTVSFVFDGAGHKPAVTYKGEVVPDEFTLSYPEDTVNAGEKIVTITANEASLLSGSIQLTYNILPLDISNIWTLTVAEGEYTFNGAEHTPAVTVTDGENEVSDYDLSYISNISAGTGFAVATAKGNFCGNVSGEFTIAPKQLSEGFAAPIDTQIYSAQGSTPEFSLTDTDLNLPLTQEDYTFEYQNNFGIGEGEIKVQGIGNYQGEIIIPFEIAPLALEEGDATLSNEDFTFNGEELTPEVTVTKEEITLTENTDYTLTVEGDNKNVGKVMIKVKGINNYTGELTLYYDISALELSADWVNDIEDVVYSGNELTPAVTLNGLTEQDFSVTYQNNLSVGEATAVITGKGNYKGEVTKTFNILPKPLELSMAEEIPAKTFTASGVKPAFNLTGLTEEDYTFTFGENNAVGEGQIFVTGKGNYTGDITLTFEILPLALNKEDVVLSADKFLFTGSEINPEVTVTKEEITLTENTDYTVTVEGDNKNVGKVMITVSGIGNYEGSLNFYYDITAREIEETWIVALSDKVYTGEALTPALNIHDGINTLEEGTDYTLSYENNLNVGTATATVTAKGNYIGTVTVTFNITPAEMTAITVEPSKTYTSYEITPEPTLLFGERELVLGTDYTLSYENNILVGEASVTATGIGNFKGELSSSFLITKKDIAELDISLIQTAFQYDKKPHKPTLNPVTYGQDELLPNSHYTLAYSGGDFKNIGTYTVTVTATDSNYTGEVALKYGINPADIYAEDFTLSNSTFVYNGNAQVPQIYFDGEVINDSNGALAGSGFTVTYSDSVNIGQKEINITASSPYKGSVTLNYIITPLDINDYINENSLSLKYEINGTDLNSANLVYNATQFKPTVIGLDGLTQNDFEIIYQNNINAGENTAEMIIKGIGNYKGVVLKQFTIKPYAFLTENCVITLATDQYDYTGKEVKPTLASVEVDGFSLTPDDYVLTYENNINLTGETKFATLIMTAKGNFVGTQSTRFYINVTSFSKLDPSVVKVDLPAEGYTYDGSAKVPAVTVDGLTKDTDYDLIYWNNTNAGLAQVIIRGKGGYSGLIIKGFSIFPKHISDKDVTLNAENCVYTGSGVMPQITVKVGDVTLQKNIGYTETYIRNLSAGIATVAVVGVGNYYGTILRDFEIKKRSLSEDMFSVPETVVYTGKAIEPNITASYGAGSDYELSFSNNKSYGKATVTVTGKNNCEGEVTLSFMIIPAKAKMEVESAGYNKSQLTWTKQSGVTGYQIYRSLDKETWEEVLKRKGASNITYTDADLTAGIAYFYKLRAFKVIEGKTYYGEWSATQSVVPMPNEVTSLQAVSVAYNKIKLSWAKQSGVTGYKIYNQVDGEMIEIASIKGASNITYTVDGLTAGQSYTYIVRAYKSVDGNLIFGAEGYKVSAAPKPNKVTISDIENSARGEVTLTWKKQSGVTGYQVCYSTSKNGSYKTVMIRSGASKTTFTHEEVSRDKTYYYKVRAYKSVNGEKVYGSYSSAKSVYVD